MPVDDTRSPEIQTWYNVTYLFENNLLALPSSCDGEPAPDREFPDIFPAELMVPESP